MNISNRKGQLLVEMVLAIAAAAIVLAIGAQLISVSLQSDRSGTEKNVATGLLTEHLEGIRNAATEDWLNIFSLSHGTTTYFAQQSSTRWVITVGTITSTANGIVYTRSFTIQHICRASSTRAVTGITDSTGSSTTACTGSGGSPDLSTEKVNVTVSWPNAPSLTTSEYITRWRNLTCTQTSWQASREVSPTGLAGGWKFDEGSGSSTADGSGNGNTGTLASGTAWAAASSCKVGRCLSFDGVNDYVAVPDASSMNVSTSFTFAAWINKNTSTPYVYRTGSSAWTIQFLGQKLTLTEPSVADYSGNTVVTNNVWHHIAVVKSGDSGTNLTLYLDGVVDGTSSIGTVLVDNEEKQIGQYSAGVRNMSGFMDEVYLYNRALSAGEIQLLFNATTSPAVACATSTFESSDNISTGTSLQLCSGGC